MGVPAEIRQIKRPRNSFLVDQGESYVLRYAVRERAETTHKTS